VSPKALLEEMFVMSRYSVPTDGDTLM